MSRVPDAFASDTELPAETETVVIGGGIVGTLVALNLAERGIPTVLCEKGIIAGEQSGRNWGWCRVTGRDPRELPLMIDSLRQWRTMDARIGARTGYRTSGIMYLFDSDTDAGRYSAWLDAARPYEVDSRMIPAAEMESLLPPSQHRWKGALYTPTDGGAEPQAAAPAIAAAARRLGARIFTHCAARGIETEAGRITGIVTEKGRIRCRSVVLAAGAWSRLFCGNFGLALPQIKVLGSVMRTAPLPGGPEVSLKAPGFGLRKRADGGYIVSQASATITDIVPDSFRLFAQFLPALRVQWRQLRLRLGRRFLEEWRVPRRWALDHQSPFEAVRVLDPAPKDAILDEAASNLAAAYPFFRNLQVAERWGGLIDVTPDAIPIIAAAATPRGLVLATGLSGHGFGIAPGAALLAADLVSGRTPSFDATPFALDRFADRRALRLDQSV